MKQLSFGQRSGLQVNPASIGGMRLPQDTDEAIRLIRHAIDSGMRYIDTSRGYGDSEIKIGKALKDGYRQKVILSTKWAPWVTKIEESDDASADCMRRRIEESMKRLDVDYLDYYQVWAIGNRDCYDQAVAKGGMVEGIQRAITDGLVGHSGFTTHDSIENLLTYIAEATWCEQITFTYNILNLRYLAAMEAAHTNGIATVIMNPVHGGQLTARNPKLEALAAGIGARSVPDMAIRWLVSQPVVTTFISGISKTADVDDTVSSVNAGGLHPEALARVDTALKELRSLNDSFCTECKYCMPCPEGIEIPAYMHMVAQAKIWGFEDIARQRYRDHQAPKADTCAHCGRCESHCTQHLKIMQEMDYAAANLSL